MTPGMRVRTTLVGALAALAGLISPQAAFGDPPANDNFASPTALPGTEVVTLTSQTTVDATAETNEPNHAGFMPRRSVWYTFTADSPGLYALYTCGTLSMFFGVYTGDAIEALTPVMGDTDSGSCTVTGASEFEATAGTTYRIAMDTFNVNGGTFTLRLQRTQAGAVNDNFADATSMPGTSPATLTGQTNIAATAETNEPDHAGFMARRSVWYTFVPDTTGLYALYTCGTSSKILAVYTGDSINALTPVMGDTHSGSCTPTGVPEWDATAGTTYRIAVDAFGPGNFTLRSELLSTPPPPDPPAVPPGTTPTEPFNLAAALKQCKKKFPRGKRRNKCIKKAKRRAKG